MRHPDSWNPPASHEKGDFWCKHEVLTSCYLYHVSDGVKWHSLPEMNTEGAAANVAARLEQLLPGYIWETNPFDQPILR